MKAAPSTITATMTGDSIPNMSRTPRRSRTLRHSTRWGAWSRGTNPETVPHLLPTANVPPEWGPPGVLPLRQHGASKMTPSRLRTALKMAARLSMLGLPFSASIRCRLLLGRLVSVASSSKPIEALTRSRRISRATCGSPLRKAVAASSSMALAKAGSRAARSFTVSLESRVSAISSLRSFSDRRLVGAVLAHQYARAFEGIARGSVDPCRIVGRLARQSEQGTVKVQVRGREKLEHHDVPAFAC